MGCGGARHEHVDDFRMVDAVSNVETDGTRRDCWSRKMVTMRGETRHIRRDGPQVGECSQHETWTPLGFACWFRRVEMFAAT